MRQSVFVCFIYLFSCVLRFASNFIHSSILLHISTRVRQLLLTI